MNSIPADGRFVRDGEMEGLEWRGGDKGGNIESSGVIYARILIWIVSNAEEEGGAAEAAGDVCDQISAVRASEHRSKRCHFGAWRRGVLDTLVGLSTAPARHSLSSRQSLSGLTQF